jgi:type IX secretion system PorP/SprF family membrane protein
MIEKIKIFLLMAFLLCSEQVTAQYFQYSQYNFTEQRINPAMIGLTRYASVSLDYRNQKTGGDFNINSSFFSASRPFLNASTGQPWSAIGIAMQDDRSGGIFSTKELAIAYSVHVRLSRFQVLSFGAKGMYQTRSISYDGFYTGSQFIPDRGFDLSHSNGENLTELKNSFKSFSTGIYWQETDKKGRVLHHAGFSLFDFNKPEDSFFKDPSHLSSSFVFNGGFQIPSSFSNVHVFPEGLLTFSANKTSLNAGVRIQKEFNVTPKKPSDRFEVLAKYAVGRSGIIGMQLHREKFSFGLSYDFPLIRKNVGNLGALEIGLELRKLVSTKAQKLSAKRKKAVTKNQLASTKNQKPKVSQTQELKSVDKDNILKDTLSAEVPEVESVIPPVEITTITQTEGIVKAGNVKQEPLLVEKITLHFKFEFNSSDLDDETEDFLQDLTTTLKENEYLKVNIAGHTDNVGSDKFNLKLSQKRADVVKQHLIKMGISQDRLTSEGKGMHEPLNKNLTEEDRSKNRRVEISLVY